MSDLHPHRRRNPLTGEWVLVSPHRMLRPWQGQVEKAVPDERPAFDPGCYLCPGNARAGGNQNPDYDGTFVFTNDFSAVLPEGSTEASGDPLFTAEPVRGECRELAGEERQRCRQRHDESRADEVPARRQGQQDCAFGGMGMGRARNDEESDPEAPHQRSPSSPFACQASSPPMRECTRGPLAMTSAKTISSGFGPSGTETVIVSKWLRT